MSKNKPLRRRPRKRLVAQSNRIDNYFSPKTEKILNEKVIADVRNTLEDLAINSPQKKRLKLDESLCISPRKMPCLMRRANLNISDKKCYTSPIRKKSLALNIKMVKKLSPRRSVRNLFPIISPKSPIKRKKPTSEKMSPSSLTGFSKIDATLDTNANLSKKLFPNEDKNTMSNRRKRTILSSEKFIKKCDANNSESRTVSHKELCLEREEEITKLVALNCCSTETLLKKSDFTEGLNFFKEVLTYVSSCFENPEQRLFLNFPADANENGFSKDECCWEKGEYTESLIAVLQVDGFSDTALDLMRNYLSNKNFLSSKLIRAVLYYTIQFCNDEDFLKSIKLCLDQLILHSPGSVNMREYYLSLLNEDDEIIMGEKIQKGLLTYLIQALTDFYKYSSPSKAKRIRKKNKKYLDNATENITDEDEKTMQAVDEGSRVQKKKRGRSKIKGCEEVALEEFFVPNIGLVENSEQNIMEINGTLCSALNNVGKKNCVLISPETLIERQFQLLEFVVEILELDFLEWSKKSKLNALEKLVSADKTPLIAALMWDRKIGFTGVSRRMKEIFYLYAMTDGKHIKYFERLIALMAEVIRIFEGEFVEDFETWKIFIRYPYISEKCKKFSDELFFNGFQDSHSSETVCNEQISRLKSLKPAWLKLLIANRLLNQSLGSKFSGNLSSVIEILKAYTYDEDTCTGEPTLESSMEVEKSGSQPQLTKLRSKKDVNRKNAKGETVLHIACIRKKPGELKNYLLLPNVDIMIRNNNGRCPIHEAAVHGSVECCKLLYEYASNFEEKSDLLSCRSSNGSTPLLEAVFKNHVDVADYLLSVGGLCLLKHANNNQDSAFDLCGSDQMEEVLKKYSNKPVKKFLRILAPVWDIIFTLISAYFETYGTGVGLKYSHLNLSSADYNNVSFPNESISNISFLLDSSLYIRDLQLINEMRKLIEILSANNPHVKQLMFLEVIFS